MSYYDLSIIFFFSKIAFFMFLGCVVYPNNWGDAKIVDVCETSTNYFSGKCRIKWAYILAIIGIFDILLLAILALVLSQTQATNYKIATAVNIVDTTAADGGTMMSTVGGAGQHVIVAETNAGFTADSYHEEYLTENKSQQQPYQQTDDTSFRDFQI
jgi:hypothetical protein